MRRLTIAGFCAIALLSGCDQPQPKVGGGPPIDLPCPGKDVPTGEHHIGRSAQAVHFVAKGTCKVKKFIFVGNGHDPPSGFTQQTNPPGTDIRYDYDGKTPIPEPAGYMFYYVNDDPKDGNGSGIVKN